MKMKVLVIQLCLITLCDPMDCSPLGSSVQGILQARILEWVAISFSSGSSQPRDQTCISWSPALAGRYFTIWATGETLHAFLLNPVGTIQLSFKATSWNQSVLWSISSFLRTLVSSQCSTFLVFLWPPWPPFFMSSQSLPAQVFLRVISCTFWPHPSTPVLYAFFLGNIISYQAFVYRWFLNWICSPVFFESYTHFPFLESDIVVSYIFTYLSQREIKFTTPKMEHIISFLNFLLPSLSQRMISLSMLMPKSETWPYFPYSPIQPITKSILFSVSSPSHLSCPYSIFLVLTPSSSFQLHPLFVQIAVYRIISSNPSQHCWGLFSIGKIWLCHHHI